VTGRFQIEQAVREGNKARVALAGPPGSGKTWTALTLATELAAGGELLVVDTERRSASLYADVFAFKTIKWQPPYDPRELAQVVADVAGGFAVVVLDSLSHFWVGRGGTLAIVDDAARRSRDNRFAGWKSGTPAQEAMVDAILDAPCHVIATMRSKMDYVQERNSEGKTVIRRVGMAPIQRDGIEYEFTVCADLDTDHHLMVAKTRCSLLASRTYGPGQAAEMGRTLKQWLDGAAPGPVDEPTTFEERALLVNLTRAKTPEARAAFLAWQRSERIPPVGHPDLTMRQAAACRAFLDEQPDAEPGAA
jgi:cytidylate kinase